MQLPRRAPILACLIALAVGWLPPAPPSVAAPPRVAYVTKKIGGVPLEIVFVRLKDPGLRIYSVFPRQGAGFVDDFERLVAGLPPGAAAINGAYFSIENRRIVSNFIESYRLLNQAPNEKPGTTVGFTFDRSVFIERGLRISAHYVVNSGFEWWQKASYNRLHGVNTPLLQPGVKDSLKLYNFYYTQGQVPLGAGKAAVVRGGVVSEIETGLVKIPVQGYVIAAVGKAVEKIDHLKPGDSVRLEYRNARTLSPWTSPVKLALGAGPKLLTEGRVDIRMRDEGFTDPGVIRATRRLALGVTRAETLLLVVMQGAVTLKRAAEIMQMLGCQSAINLDGGASTALYYDGKIRVWPNRQLNNLLVFE